MIWRYMGIALGHREVVRVLIEEMKKKLIVNEKAGWIDTLCVKNSVGETPLHIAAMKGHKEIIQLLVTEGANIEVEDKHGYRPLHVAIVEDQKDMVEFLINNHRASVNVRSREGITPLHEACYRGHSILYNCC